MSSQRQKLANRANPTASTGPKTAFGKKRVSKNALRHGLSIPLAADVSWGPEIEAIAQRIAGKDANARLVNSARSLAEAVLDLRRVRNHKVRLIVNAFKVSQFERPEGHGRLVQSERNVEIAALIDRLRATFGDMGPQLLQGPELLARIYEDLADEFAAIDRCERRALSRRKFALRAFDAARGAPTGQ
jgi:hypothetical protein